MLSRVKRFFIGKPLNPLGQNTRRHLSLVALMAWVGLGADPLSSSCYGPEQTYLALGTHTHLALYIAIIMTLTIFIISLGYSQVIELFPGGGGGYKVATKLLHPYVGLLAGSALLIDYVLTIAVSIASGADAIFSFLPLRFVPYKIYIEAIVIILLLGLNMRGMKEVIRVLLPVVVGFMLTHVALIIYGIAAHSKGLLLVVPHTVVETKDLMYAIGFFPVIGLVLHAYSLGSGTYTGLEGVSNNVQRLAEPRVQTGKRTMLYMAVSLSVIAGGIILLYLLWDVKPIPGQTLNATVFQSILGNSWFGESMLVLVLELEAGLLLVAANSGFAGGPNVLANMAADGWIPNRFRHLSNRLVVQNGLILFGLAALGILYVTSGNVSLLVVLYSINVFITFSLSLLGISVYWIKHQASPAWFWHFMFAAFACLVTTLILLITLYYKFSGGGWLTLSLTGALMLVCFAIKRHYHYISKKLSEMERDMLQPVVDESVIAHVINPQLPTAVIFIKDSSVGMHTLLSILRLFPGQFKNFVFLAAGEVDSESFSGQTELENMQRKVETMLAYFVKYCGQYQIPAESYAAFGTDVVAELKSLSDRVALKYPHAIFFSSQLVFKKENMMTRLLHNQTPLLLQHHLHSRGRELMILPMRI